jgi:hypothetical protein
LYDFNLGTIVTNAFLIFRELGKVADDAKRVSQSDFRQILYRQITKE